MKKTVSLILAVILTLSAALFASVASFAAGPSLTVNGGMVEKGKDITVTVAIFASSGACGGNLTLKYDSDKLTAKSATAGGVLNGYTSNKNLNYQNAGNLIRFTFAGTNPLTASGTLLSIVFTAKAVGTAKLELTAYKLYDEDANQIPATAENGEVTINEPAVTTTTTTKPVVTTTTTTKPAVTTTTTKPAATTKPAVKTTKPAVKTTKLAVKTTKPAVKTTKPAVKTTKPAVKTTKSVAKTKTIRPAGTVVSPVATSVSYTEPSLAVNGGTVEKGKDITVAVVISASSGACGGNFTLKYDSDKLTAKSATAGGVLNGYTSNKNLNYQNAENLIRFTFAGTNPLTASGTLLSIVFTAKAAGTAKLELTESKLYNADGLPITNAVLNGEVRINGEVSIEVSPKTLKLSYKKSAKLEATVTGGGEVLWESDAPSVIEVDPKTGSVKAVKTGSATITAKLVDADGKPIRDADGREISDSCKIRVKYAWWQWLAPAVLLGFILAFIIRVVAGKPTRKD